MRGRRSRSERPTLQTWPLLGRAVLTLTLELGIAGQSTASETTIQPCADQPGAATTIEMTLAKHWRPRAAEIKRELRSGPGSITTRIAFTPMAAPPMNIGIGRCVDADTARNAIRAAIAYNGGIEYLIFQDILPHRWIMIGTTQVAELSWTRVGREDLDQLSAPGLSTGEFQMLYRTLATPKERKRPFGLDAPPAP
ncbi:MAG: hypothetical protein ACOYXR_06775 [Nitrospirota bacterium]